MKSIKLSIVAALLATTSVVTSATASEVEVSANMALTSNYIWRGMTQTGNSPAIQGGVDLGYKGAYIGVWGSSFDSGADSASAEFDLYAGYAGEVNKFSYDIGLIQYMYPNDTKALNFSEAYLTLGYDFDVASVSVMYAKGLKASVDTSSDFGDVWEAGISIPLPSDITLDGTYGNYNDKDTVTGGNENSFGDYYLVGLSKSVGKFDVSVAYTGMNFKDTTKEDQNNLVVTLSTSF